MTPPIRSPEQQLRIRKNEEPGFFPLSYSRLKEYKDCKLRYKFTNIDKMGRISGDAADLGSAAHTFQEIMHTDGIEKANEMARVMVPLSRSDDWLNAKKVIESIVIKKDFLYSVEARLHWEFPAGKIDTNSHGERVYSNPYIIQVESKIDQLFVYPEKKTIEIIDGKSGAQVPNEKELQDDPQGKFYGVVVLENIGELEIERVIFTQAQWKYGRLVSAEFSIEQLDEFRQQIMADGKAMLNEQEFEPTPGNHCHWCPFVMSCNAAQKMLPKTVVIAGIELPPVITNDEEAVKIGKGVIHLEEVTKRFREALRGYARETKKPVLIENGGWGWWKRSTLKLADLPKMMTLAKKKNIDIASFLSFNNKIGKTLVKNHPEFLEGLTEEAYPFFDFKVNVNEDDK